MRNHGPAFVDVPETVEDEFEPGAPVNIGVLLYVE
jgi:hypothetical protein